MQRKLEAFESWKSDTQGLTTENTPDDNDDSPPTLLPLTEEDEQIISTVEDIIKHKAKPNSKAKAKARVADEHVKQTLKEPKAKQIALLPNQTLQIKLPDGEKTFKIGFI